jgi:uncharacterized protein affecting Mg2+/Co2+ transport
VPATHGMNKLHSRSWFIVAANGTNSDVRGV